MNILEQTIEEETDINGIFKILGELPTGTIINENALTQIFKRHSTSLKRAISRGELPPPTKLFGDSTWTVGSIINHIENRLNEAKQDFNETQKRLLSYST